MDWPFYMDASMIFWGAIAVIAVAGMYFNYRASVSRDRTIQTLAEKGQPIPPELLERPYRVRRDWRHRHRSPLRTGVILMCVGIGILFVMAGPVFWYENGAFHFDHGERFPIAGAIIPFMIGFAFFIIGLFDRRDPPPSPPPS